MTEKDVLDIFSNADIILNLHKTVFHELLACFKQFPQKLAQIGDVFINLVRKMCMVLIFVTYQAPSLKIYSVYVNNYDKATEILNRAKQNPTFSRVISELEQNTNFGNLRIGDFLIAPVTICQKIFFPIFFLESSTIRSFITKFIEKNRKRK